MAHDRHTQLHIINYIYLFIMHINNTRGETVLLSPIQQY